ncbi:hypothetical protein [Catellatospora methionotrophica]|uniref:hypothetical protein n=1 Tax=Catellatospora methionotrophica TaxID=121620 RepID=UPI00340AAC80
MVKLSVKASHDDGKTWVKVPVLCLGGDRVVTVAHPRAGGCVSLQASGADSKGNTVNQTVIRVYEIR